MGKSAILLGGSGLIGSHLLTLLLESDSFEKIKVYVRKELPIKHLKLEQIITDFKDLETLSKSIDGTVIFSCLGSTKSKTPNLKDYRKVDYDIPLYFAEQGLQNGINQYHLVSSMGANASSSNFYTKLKGEIENAIKHLKYQTIVIYQPSFLIGERTENRPMEKIAASVMQIADFLLVGSLKKYRSIAAEDVAKAMFNESIKNKRGIFVNNSEQIKILA